MAAPFGRPRLWALATGLVGLVAIVIALGFARLPLVVEAGPACFPAGAVVRFEFATTADDLRALFGEPGDACHDKALAAMDQSNRFDVFGFIPAYTAFGLLAVVFLARRLRSPLAMAAFAASLLAMVCDYIETLNLLQITQDLVAGESLLATASTAAWAKFALLGFHALLLAAICLTDAPRRRILGVLLLLPAPAVAWTWLHPDFAGIMSYIFAAGWIALTVVALWTALRPPSPPA